MALAKKVQIYVAIQLDTKFANKKQLKNKSAEIDLNFFDKKLDDNRKLVPFIDDLG